ncbi:MAG: S46 family peptidase [Bacteroidales bacterium]|nr:S46 family peptidase [Bacteroidales bacterium]
MKKSILLAVVAVLSFNLFAINPPDEGMWLPMFIKNYNYAEMQRLGLQLTPEQLYDINNSSLKDAIVQLGDGFCTGEMVSRDGLMFTNHHCGYSSVVELSTVEHDYLNNGFFAMSRKEELRANFHVNFLERMEDVTSIVLAEVTDSTKEGKRAELVKKAIEKLKKENSDNGKHNVVVKPFYEGNEYYMFIYTTYNDVRLVCAPPASIGKFGGDTDNWMWPRHTGDFTVFRIYTAPDGSPADYSEDNVPMHPKHFLPISIKGYQPGDYTMIWGYPGTTERFMTSFEVKNAINITDPALYEPFDILLPVIKAEMDANTAVELQYADDYAGYANMWKNKHGEAESLKALHVVEKKQAQEAELTKWINADPERQKKYGKCLAKIEKVCNELDGDAYRAVMNANLCLYGCPTLMTAFSIRNSLRLEDKQKSFSEEKIAKVLAQYDKALANKDVNTEIKTILATFKTWERLPEGKRVDVQGIVNKYFKGNQDAFENAVANSIFVSHENLEKYLRKPNAKTLQNDPLSLYMNEIFTLFLANQQVLSSDSKMEVARRQYIAAIKEMKAATPIYPDANSTMRTTYGTVCDYYPADGVHYNYFTTTKGILEKEIPGDPEFDVSPKLKQLILNKDFGQYADKDGTLHVCFLSNNDITGGNSGSPIMNGNGELIGLAFDGNWEALSSDIVFNTELQRCINVDSRYVLFVIDKFGGAGYLLDEMDIRK